MTTDHAVSMLYTLTARLCLSTREIAATPVTEDKLAETLEMVRTLRLQAKTILHTINAAEVVVSDALDDYREKLEAQLAASQPQDKRTVQSLLGNPPLSRRPRTQNT